MAGGIRTDLGKAGQMASELWAVARSAEVRDRIAQCRANPAACGGVAPEFAATYATCMRHNRPGYWNGYRNYLPTHFQYAWIDSLSTPIRYDDMLRGAGLACVYTAVFLGWAWLRFDRKDVTS